MNTNELEAAMYAAVDAGQASSIAWLIAVGEDLRTGTVGFLDGDDTRPTRTDTIFRISSMTKPLTAFAALQLVDDGVLALDDPIDALLPRAR